MSAQFKTLLVATDFSEASEHAMEHAHALAHSLGARLHLLHVVPGPVPASAWSEHDAYDLAALSERLRTQAEQEIAKRARSFGDVAVTTEVVIGSPAAAIAATAAKRGIDMIVMGTHGRSGFSHLVVGSVAERVVRSAPCPVLTIRQPMTERDERAVANLTTRA